MNYNKSLLFFRGCLIQIKSSKSRLFLTVAGVILAAVLYLTASIAVETYISDLYKEAKACSSEGILLTGTIQSELLTDMELKFPHITKSEFMTPITSFSYLFTSRDFNFAAIPILIGTSSDFMDIPVYSTQGISSMYTSKIVQGRDISYKDITQRKRVVVISSLAAKIFFPKEEAIGNMIELSLTGKESDKESFEVIGIYENGYDEKKVLEQLEIVKKKGNAGSNLLLNFYIPKSVYYDYTEYVSKDLSAVVFDSGVGIEIKKTVENYYSVLEMVDVNYQEKKIREVNEINNDMLFIMDIVMLVMMLIAGLNLFNSMMFSIRERISEIGIRKALGASNIDILKQFVFEGVLISAIGVLIALVITIFFMLCCQIILNKYTALDIKIVCNLKIFIKMVCYMLMMSLIFSLIPALIAAKTKIIEAIRFD